MIYDLIIECNPAYRKMYLPLGQNTSDIGNLNRLIINQEKIGGKGIDPAFSGENLVFRWLSQVVDWHPFVLYVHQVCYVDFCFSFSFHDFLNGLAAIPFFILLNESLTIFMSRTNFVHPTPTLYFVYPKWFSWSKASHNDFLKLFLNIATYSQPTRHVNPT